MRRSSLSTILFTLAAAGPALAQPVAPDAPEAPLTTASPSTDPVATDAAAPMPPPSEEPVAEAPPAEASPEAPPAPSWAERVTMTGLVDGYFAAPFQGDFRQPDSLRVFDGGNGSFLLAYAELAVAMAADPAGFRLDLGFGPVADLTSLETTTTGTPPTTVTGPSEVWKHVQQAYASVKLPGARSIVVDAGKFVTTAGAEVIEAKDNWLYTRSILFGYAIPFTHTGVRITAAVDDKLSVQGMIVNGWDVGLDNNDAKTFGASALYADADSGLTGAATVLVGKEASDTRVLADLVVGKKFGALAVNLNLDYGKDGDASWFGVAALARDAVSPRLNLTGRGEHFRDPDGVRTAIADGVAVSEVTLGAGVPVGSNAEVRFEGRIDVADADVFDGGSSSTQGTATAAAMAWF